MSEKRWWSTGDDYVETKTSGIVQEERAQHSQLEEEVRVLVGDKVGQLKEADDLQHQAEVLHIRMDITKTAVDKVTLKSCTHKKVRGQLLHYVSTGKYTFKLLVLFKKPLGSMQHTH